MRLAVALDAVARVTETLEVARRVQPAQVSRPNVICFQIPL